MKKINKIVLAATALWLLFTANVYADDTAQTAGAQLPSKEQFILIIVLSVSAVVLLVLMYMLYALNIFLTAARKSGDMNDIPAIFKLTDAVPVEREEEIILDHNYDGIRELDNKLPPWWVYMFYATIVFGVFYMWYYHLYGSGNIQEDEYIAEMEQAEIQMKLMANKVDENSVALLTDAAKIKNGEAIFVANCAPCHGKQGQGGVGPNLTDEYWLHGGGIKDIFKTVKYGIPAKGMIPWQSQLGPGQIQEVSSYIMKLKGTNPANPKAPQGELYKE